MKAEVVRFAKLQGMEAKDISAALLNAVKLAKDERIHHVYCTDPYLVGVGVDIGGKG